MHLSDNHGTSSVLEPAYSVVRATALQDQTSHSYLVVLLVVAAGWLWWLQFYSFCLCVECERLYDVAAPVLSGVNHLHDEQANGLRSREGGRGERENCKITNNQSPASVYVLPGNKGSVQQVMLPHVSRDLAQPATRYH